MDKIRILFLAANPTDTTKLRLGEEVRAIDEELLKAKFRDKFDLKQKHAVKADSFSQHLLQVEPDILHFSGHGSRAGQIFMEDVTGQSHPVSVQALSTLFRVLKGNVRCVVLNACYSEKQAKAISKHVDCVIGMSKAIGDEAAIKFAQGFYRGIGWGKDVETAFNLGCLQVDLHNLDEQDTPKILWKNNQPQQIIFSQMAKTVSNAIVSSIERLEQISNQLESVVTNSKEREGPRKHGAKIERNGSDIVLKAGGQICERITADRLENLPKSQYKHIMVLQKSMYNSYDLWAQIYPQRNASPDPLVNARVEQQLKNIVSNMKGDFNRILNFLESLNLYLSDHYMHIREIVNSA